MIDAPVTVTFGEPYPKHAMRYATLRIGGVEIFSEIVYDTDGAGNRTEAQAARNLLTVLGERLRKVVD
jgi:hypothetical protein